MGIERVKDNFENLEKAFNTLKEAVFFDKYDEIIKRDVVIKRFEYTIESFWKMFKRYLSFIGYNERLLISPKGIMKQAYYAQLVDNEDAWYNMLEDRNILVHVYDEDEINKIYKTILEKYFPEMQISFEKLKKEINK